MPEITSQPGRYRVAGPTGKLSHGPTLCVKWGFSA